MSIVDGIKKLKSIGRAEIRENGYLYINDEINFFTGEKEVNGVRQHFVLGVPVKYDVDKNGRKYAVTKRSSTGEFKKFLFDVSEMTSIEMCVDGDDNDERYATYFYYDANGICQHSVFSDQSGYNILVENDYDSKGRVVRCHNHKENLTTKITYEQDTFHVQCCQSASSSGEVVKDVYGYSDGTIKGFVRMLGERRLLDNLKYIGNKHNRIIPGINYDSLVWNIINFDMNEWGTA